jgi:hypothetical protein
MALVLVARLCEYGLVWTGVRPAARPTAWLLCLLALLPVLAARAPFASGARSPSCPLWPCNNMVLIVAMWGSQMTSEGAAPRAAGGQEQSLRQPWHSDTHTEARKDTIRRM